jgi:hypothetical protein
VLRRRLAGPVSSCAIVRCWSSVLLAAGFMTASKRSRQEAKEWLKAPIHGFLADEFSSTARRIIGNYRSEAWATPLMSFPECSPRQPPRSSVPCVETM